MKSKILIILIILSLFFFLRPLPSPSQPMEKPWRKGNPCWRASELNLSFEQRRQLESLQQVFLRETQRIRTELFSKRLEFRELLIDPNIKIEMVRSKYLEIEGLQSKLEERVAEYLIQVRTLLTEDQIRNWCPEEEFALFRHMRHRPWFMSP